MEGITLRNGLISYYGNPAGYSQKDMAVLDCIFQNDELTAWVQNRGLIPQWKDGVMECLLAGEQTGERQKAESLKNIRIWQLKPEADVSMKFVDLDEMERKFGMPDPVNYRVAYDGQLGTNDLEEIYIRCNADHPHGYNGHSLSMSDVVELYDVGGDGLNSSFYYCDRFTFREISFEGENQGQVMEPSMSQTF